MVEINNQLVGVVIFFRTCARDCIAGAIQVYMEPPKSMDKSVRDARKYEYAHQDEYLYKISRILNHFEKTAIRTSWRPYWIFV